MTTNTSLTSAPATFNPATPGTSDQFTLTFSELRGGAPSPPAPPPPGSMTVTISLSQAQADFPDGSNAADQIASEINKQVTTAVAGTPAFAGLAAKASVNSYGQLVLQSRGDINVDASGVGGMGQAGLTYLGLTAGTQTTTDPYINVQVGADPPVQISIIPGEDQNGLVASLQGTNISGVPGLGATLDPLTGFLTLRPGDSTTNPTFGGDLTTVTGGPFPADGTGTIGGGMAAGTPIIAALFGSSTPVSSIPYSSANAIGPATAFRTSNLGPSANISTGITSDGSLIDYSQQVINVQAQQVNNTQTQLTDETTYSNTLQ